MKNTNIVLAGILVLTFSLLQSCKQEIVDPPRLDKWISFTKSNSDLDVRQIHTIHVDGEGTIWFGTDSGAYSFKNGFWSVIKDSLSYGSFGQGGSSRSKIVTSIGYGYDASLWFGLKGGGLARYNKSSTTQPWVRYRSPDVPLNSISAVACDKIRPGDVWVATLAGIGRYTPDENIPGQGSWHTYDVGSGVVPTNQFRSAGVNPVNNSIWFGSHDAGLIMYDGTRWETLPIETNSPVWSLAFDVLGNVWCATWQGVSVYNLHDHEWRRYTVANTGGKLPTNVINAVTTDMNSTRWFGTNMGLYRLQDTTWTSYRRAEGVIPSDTITTLSYDRRGNLWIGTSNGATVHNDAGVSF